MCIRDSHSGAPGNLILPISYTDCIVVPQVATFELQDKVYVYKIVDGKASSVMIDVEKINNGREYIVKSGLVPGDVIVAEGFSGNVLLKTMEGVGSFAGSALKAMFKKNLLTKLAALCVMPGLNAFKAKLYPNKVGGTAFIGISRPVIKAHGSSNAEAIENAMGQAVQVARSGIIRDIEENVALMKVERE